MAIAGAVELRDALNAQFQVELPATVTFDYPTPAAMTTLLMTMREGETSAAILADISVDGSSIASWASSLQVTSFLNF